MVETASAPPERNKKRAVVQGRHASLTKAKACKILEDGKVQGRPLTEKQRGLFGAVCSGAPSKRKR